MQEGRFASMPRLRGVEPGLPEFWGPGLGAGASRGLGGLGLDPKLSAGGRQAKGGEAAETAAAEVGAWREAGAGYAFLGCKGEKKRVFTLSVTETIQHAPLGRRINWVSPCSEIQTLNRNSKTLNPKS